MKRFLIARLVQAGVVALVVGGLCFALMRALPGDAAMRIAASRYGPDAMNAAAADRVRVELGLDRSWFAQLIESIGDLVRLNLGRSLVSGEPVVHELQIQLSYSLLLAAAAMLFSLALGPTIGLIAGLRPGSMIDRGNLVASVALRAMPPFFVGLILMLIFSVWLGWLPPAGFGSVRDIILPAFTLALGLAAVSSRVTRDAVLSVSQAPYFAYARLKGLSEAQAIRHHGLRNAAIPVVAYLGLQTVYLIEGVVVVEAIFAWPGIGHALVHAIIARDIPIVQGTALVMGLLFVLIGAVVDLACKALDPRLGNAR